MASEPLRDFDGLAVNRLVTLGLVPLAPLTALIVGTNLVAPLLAALLFAGMALLSKRVEPKAQPLILSVAMIGQCIAFTGAFAGHPWQLDSHMLFFAVLAIVATMNSVPAVVMAVVVIALHHLGLGLAAPLLVYPDAGVTSVILRTVMHAAIVLFEAAVLIWTMRQSNRARIAMQTAREEADRAAREAAALQAEAEHNRERAVLAAERTRADGERAAAALEEIAATARAAADSAAHATALVARTEREGEKSNAVVASATSAMKAIEQSSIQIGEIVTVIDEIARQTDLLALNAAVESARAGEAGRGFAVVANEVRKLAQRSADAAQQIRALVTTSGKQVVEGVGLVDETGKALQRIVTAIAELNSVIGNIAVGAEEQSRGLSQVSLAISHLDDAAGQRAPTVLRRRQAA
jgi:hypothetical protein